MVSQVFNVQILLQQVFLSTCDHTHFCQGGFGRLCSVPCLKLIRFLPSVHPVFGDVSHTVSIARDHVYCNICALVEVLVSEAGI